MEKQNACLSLSAMFLANQLDLVQISMKSIVRTQIYLCAYLYSFLCVAFFKAIALPDVLKSISEISMKNFSHINYYMVKNEEKNEILEARMCVCVCVRPIYATATHANC